MFHDNCGDLDQILADRDALLGEPDPPLVLATNSELINVLEGREITFAADDGTEVRLRLYNTDELLKADLAVALTHEAETGCRAPRMTREQATGLCQPLGIALARMRRLP